MSEIEKNKEVLSALQSDPPTKARASKLEKNLCVMLLEAIYSISTGKVSANYHNIRQVAGDEPEVDFF